MADGRPEAHARIGELAGEPHSVRAQREHPRSVALPALITHLDAHHLAHGRAQLIYRGSEPLPRKPQSPRAPTECDARVCLPDKILVPVR